MIDIQKQFKRLKNPNILYALSNLIFLGTLFVSDIYIARAFSLDKVGAWKQLLLLVQFTAVLLSFGVSEGFRFNISKNPHKVSEYLGTSLLFIIVISLLLWGGLTSSKTIKFVADSLGIDVITNVGFLIPLLYLLLSLNLLYLQICLLKNQITVIFFVMLAFGILFPIILYSLLFFTQFLFEVSLLLSFVLVFFIQTILYIKLTNVIPKIRLRGYMDSLIKIIKFGFPLFIATYIGVLTLHIDKVIINKLGGIEAFAIYSVGALEIPLIALITKSFVNVTYPKIVNLVNVKDIGQAKILWVKDLVKVSYISYPIICLLMLFSKTIITGIFGETYHDSVSIFKAYCLLLLWRNGVYGTIISVREKTLLIAKYSLIALIVNVFFSFILFRYYGVIGVIYSTFIAITVLHLLFMKYEMVISEYYTYFLRDKRIISLLLLIIVLYFFIKPY